eukprot:3185806-Prymnesium_polylepis.1
MHAGTRAVRTPPRDRIVVTARDFDCSTTGCDRGTRPTLKSSQRAPYHAFKVETETSRHLVARARQRFRSNANTVTARLCGT